MNFSVKSNQDQMKALGVFGFQSSIMVCDSPQHIVGTLLDTWQMNDLGRTMEKHTTLAPGKTQASGP